MEETLQNYKCPNCGGTVTFDSELQKMKCPFCDSIFEVEQFSKKDTQWNVKSDQWEDENLRSYICSSCGGEIVADATLGASACPFCGSTVVMKEQFSGMLKPDYVIPFKISKEEAIASYKKALSKKKLLNKIFKKSSHLDEIKGLYVPIWLFDVKADGDVILSAQKVRTWSDSTYHYTETSYYELTRKGCMEFEKVPEDGSSKMDDTMMESIGPFDFSEAVDFKSAYLSGYLADRYDVESDMMFPRLEEVTRASLKKHLMDTVHGYTSVSEETSTVDVLKGEIKYALYPVWTLATKWKEKDYLFAVNGQTGKFAGNLPLDLGQFFKWFIGLGLGIAAVVFALSALILI